MYDIPWTSDGLSDAYDSTTVEVAHVGQTMYALVCDVSPKRWYIRRSGPGPYRTVVYGSRNAPTLRRAWTRIVADSRK